ncbi:MAG: hypothetical protein EOP00_23000 [Pedobacter sp.]|nr:MAG: hypothetical protein EOP00_23000 [Pedobacter sp.]
MLKTASGKFTKHLQLKNAQASTRGIVSDNNDNLYVGSYAGLFKINTKTKATKAIFDPLYDYNYYNSLLVEKDSILWITGEDLFIKSMNLKTNKITDYRYKGKKNEFYSSFIKQKSVDSLWIGSDVGLYVFDKKSKRISKYPHHYAPPKPLRVEDLLESKDGNLWLATNLGLYFKERGKPFVEYLGNNNFFKNQSILTLYEDKNNNLWIGTNNLGVIMLDITNDKLSVYNQSKGLSNNSVCGILESKNSMWFSTYYGLSSLSKQTKKFNNFYEENGISDNEFNSRSVYKKNDTTFYFGGLNGITEFNPEKITFRRKKQKIFLSVSEYYSKGKQENIKDYSITNKVISLPYDKNYFSAEFTMNDLFYKEKNDYYYKIEGLTNGWINVGSSGSVKLFGLPAGNHILLVKGRDFEGFETVNTIKINIRVEQIFFKAPWFITLIILLIAMLIIYIFRKNAHRQKKIFEREKEIIELKSSALKSQMNPHFVFNILNNMQSVMILKGELAVNKYFVAFSRLLRSTLDMSKKELVSLKEEIEYINNYVLLNKLQLNEELEFNLVIDESIKHPEALFIPGMLIQPFVENAILHGLIPKNGKKKLTIEYKLQENFLIISIVDNGVGREASKLVKSNKVFMYESWSTSIVNDRVRLLNLKNKDNVNIDIIDNGENNEKGTKVILRFKI